MPSTTKQAMAMPAMGPGCRRGSSSLWLPPDEAGEPGAETVGEAEGEAGAEALGIADEDAEGVALGVVVGVAEAVAEGVTEELGVGEGEAEGATNTMRPAAAGCSSFPMESVLP